jgi:hypothetical protein
MRRPVKPDWLGTLFLAKMVVIAVVGGHRIGAHI